VLQGPGCLNYSVVLKIEGNEKLQSISAANQFIMERNRAAIQSVLAREPSSSLMNQPPAARPPTLPSTPPGERVAGGRVRRIPGKLELNVRGHTDLTLDGLKFSGNSQRRRRHFLLFHGTFLLNFDIALVEDLLALPSKQPDYRRHRSHRDFLVNLGVPAASVKAALANTWDATNPTADVPRDQIGILAREKYLSRDWTMKF
jgi:lipoate-protein ligase A